MRNRWWAASGAAAAVALLAACGSSAATSGSGGSNNTSSPPAASSGGGQTGSTTASTSASGIKTAKTGLGTVLVTAQGRTIYMFAIDKPNKSVCNSSDCLKFWPPLKGNPSEASGANLPGKFGTTTRSDGTTQATYDGHPLYLFSEDTAPGQTRGNGLNENGGLWYAITPSGAKPSGSTGGNGGGSGGSGGGGGGYGY